MSVPADNQRDANGVNVQESLTYFPCPSCGKSLKTKTSAAGKKIRCPQCRQIAIVPPQKSDAPPPPKPEAPSPPKPDMPTPIWRIVLPPFLLAIVLWATFVLQLHNLDHTGLTRWDEVFHALVAKNVAKHPLTPTLVDEPFLPYDQMKWGENHVWLHKPILPFWQVALSFMLLGVNTFSLRLPAAILNTAAACLTYLIGKEILDRRAALIAATIQAINPFLMRLVHGYQFADNIDISLLFWVEVGVYFLVRSLRTGSWTDILLAGFAQGLAFLSKSHLAAIIFGIALTAWLLPICRVVRPENCRIGFFRLLGMAGVTVLTIAPWTIYCAVSFPEEFWHEQSMVFRHLYDNVEAWGAPWDRLVFDYMIAIHGVFYTPILVASLALMGKAVMQRHAGLWLLYAWSLGVVLPHLFAVTKTPSATIIAMPALLLLLGGLISDAWRGQRWQLAVLAGVLVMSLIITATPNPGHGYPATRAFGGVMRNALWVVYHCAVALTFGAIAVGFWVLIRRFLPSLVGRVIHVVAMLFCAGVLVWLGYRSLDAAWRVTKINSNDVLSVNAGRYARDHLPVNAVLFCENRSGYDHLTTMFYADRTCYPLVRQNLDVTAQRILDAGGIPYIVSLRKLPYRAVHTCPGIGPTIYEWHPPGRAEN